MIKKILVSSIFAVLVFSISFSVHEVYATLPTVTVLPHSVAVGDILTVSGTGFPAGLHVFIFLDTTNVDSTTVAGDGSFIITFPVPTSTGLGPHFIIVSDDPNVINPLALPVSFTVTQSTSIPEFPFSFSLVIIFVAVTAMYMVIRQKMTTNFKRW